MTWSSRFKLLGGFLAITVLMAALTLLFNQRQSRVASSVAVVEAPTAMVGSGYGGVVIAQNISAGEQVQAGDPLFVVASPELLNDVSQGFEPQSTQAYSVDLLAGTLTYHAVSSGQVQDVAVSHGSYLQPGGNLATIASDSPKTVVAEFVLQPADYGRIEKGAPATLNLANNAQLAGAVSDISVVTQGDQAITTVRITSDDLTDPQYANLTRAGSPVQAVLTLRDDGVLAGPTAAMEQFLVKIGLR